MNNPKILPTKRIAAIKVILLITASLLGLSGCATFSEKFYFRVKENPNSDPEYFRVTIKGSTFFSESRYSAGFYDKGAVDELFGEIKVSKSLSRALINSKTELLIAEEDLKNITKLKKELDTAENKLSEKETFLGHVQEALEEKITKLKSKKDELGASRDLQKIGEHK